MNKNRGKKRSNIKISSSSSSSSSEDDDDDDEYEQKEEDYSQSDYSQDTHQTEPITLSSSDDDDDDDDDGDDDGDGGGGGGGGGDDEINDEGGKEGSCDRVIRCLQDKSDLQKLKLRDCHFYLRHYGLRITGTKAECVERIVMHWRIKDTDPEALYPRSSFVVNCTGDVCRGDVVLFKQRVKKFNKKRSKQFRAIRTVAGTVVRESYGASAQQHTFTIEVLWSRACKDVEQLSPLSYLLVKGRKLYRMGTFRQLWRNESERQEVLTEKHERGDAARLTRAMNMAVEKAICKSKGIKRQKLALHATPSTLGKKADAKRGNHGKTKKEKVSSTKRRQKVHREKRKKESKAKDLKSPTNCKNSIHPHKKQCSIAQPNPHPSHNFHPPPVFHQTQMHPNFPFGPRLPIQNYDPVSQFPRFPSQNFHQQLHPSFPRHPPNFHDTNAQSYPYPPHIFHPSQTHHDIRVHPHHSQSFQRPQMQHYHLPWNVDRAPPHYLGPSVIQASQNRGLNYVYSDRNRFDPGNVNHSRFSG